MITEGTARRIADSLERIEALLGTLTTVMRGQQPFITEPPVTADPGKVVPFRGNDWPYDRRPKTDDEPLEGR
jgi:hypothetical protein